MRAVVRPPLWLGAALSLVVAGNGLSLYSITTSSEAPEASPKVMGTQVLRGSGAKEKDKSKDDGPHSFLVQGDIVGLHPGMRSELRVTVHNENNFEMVVQELSADIADIVGGEGQCPRTVGGRPTVVVDPFSGSMPVPQNSTAARDLTIMMDPAAPDGCSGATFHLAYHGRAVKP